MTYADRARQRDVSVAGMKVQEIWVERREINCLARDKPRKD